MDAGCWTRIGSQTICDVTNPALKPHPFKSDFFFRECWEYWRPQLRVWKQCETLHIHPSTQRSSNIWLEEEKKTLLTGGGFKGNALLFHSNLSSILQSAWLTSTLCTLELICSDWLVALGGMGSEERWRDLLKWLGNAFIFSTVNGWHTQSFSLSP